MSYSVGGAARRTGPRRSEGVFGAFGEDEPMPPTEPPTHIPGWTDIQDWAQQNVPGWGTQPDPGMPGAPPPPGSVPVPAPVGPPQGSQILGPDPDMTKLLAVGIAAVGVVAFVWVMRQ